ncbi:MAG: NUDIX domain-containing protein [Hyphomicrobiaceae bacterium]
MTVQRLVTRTMQRYWRFSRGLTLGAQGAVIDPNGRFLLVRHTYRPGWHFPGGGVERGETALTALERELQEEAGVLLEGPPHLFGLYGNHRLFPGDHIALFVVRAWRQPDPPGPNREIAEQAFFAIDSVPETTHAATLRRMREIVGGASPADEW